MQGYEAIHVIHLGRRGFRLEWFPHLGAIRWQFRDSPHCCGPARSSDSHRRPCEEAGFRDGRRGDPLRQLQRAMHRISRCLLRAQTHLRRTHIPPLSVRGAGGPADSPRLDPQGDDELAVPEASYLAKPKRSITDFHSLRTLFADVRFPPIADVRRALQENGMGGLAS